MSHSSIRTAFTTQKGQQICVYFFVVGMQDAVIRLLFQRFLSMTDPAPRIFAEVASP